MGEISLTDLLTTAVSATARGDSLSLDDPELHRMSVWDIVRLVGDDACPPERRDSVLTAIVRGYREHRSSTWSTPLLAILAPALDREAGRFRRALPAGVDREDVRQQFVVAALAVAAVMPDVAEGMYDGLVNSARLRVARWLRREWRHSHESWGSTELEDSEAQARLDDAMTVADLGRQGLSFADFFLAYRWRVAGMTLGELAKEQDTTVGVIRGRLRQVMARLAEMYPDLFEEAGMEAGGAA